MLIKHTRAYKSLTSSEEWIKPPNSLKHDQTLSSLETFWLQKTEARPTNIHQNTSEDLLENQRVWGENHSESSVSGFFFNF